MYTVFNDYHRASCHVHEAYGLASHQPPPEPGNILERNIEPCSTLCHLPERGIRECYPCSTHILTLVLPYSIDEDGPILHQDTPICLCGKFAIRCLHRWVHPFSPVVVLPPVFSPDIGLPNVYPLDELPMLWTNTEYTVPASDDDTNVVGHLAMNLVTTSHLEANAKASQISLTDQEFICYMTVDVDANSANGNKADKTGDTKVTPLKKAKKSFKKTTKKEVAIDGDDSSLTSSQDPDAGLFSNEEAQQQVPRMV